IATNIKKDVGDGCIPFSVVSKVALIRFEDLLQLAEDAGVEVDPATYKRQSFVGYFHEGLLFDLEEMVKNEAR
ncbi:MAG: hypothetical protein N2738_04560, partial [Thermodesulfovibrionales bacterium]|nr:hypothetical protein [Thermodesulfovibrionales bacterium]